MKNYLNFAIGNAIGVDGLSFQKNWLYFSSETIDVFIKEGVFGSFSGASNGVLVSSSNLVQVKIVGIPFSKDHYPAQCIEGYSMNDCDSITVKDATNYSFFWKGNSDLSELR